MGLNAILFRLDDGSALKIYGNSIGSERQAREEFKKMKFAYDLGLDVPQPYEVTEVEVSREDLKDIPFWDKFKHESFGENAKLDSLTSEWEKAHREETSIRLGIPNLGGSRSCYALRRQFIEGRPLNDYFFPCKKIREKMRRLHASFNSANLVGHDIFSSNYILTDEGRLVYIDCQQLEQKPQNPGKLWSMQHKFFLRYGSICALEDIFLHIYGNITQPLYGDIGI